MMVCRGCHLLVCPSPGKYLSWLRFTLLAHAHPTCLYDSASAVQMDLMAAPWDEKLEDGGARAFFQPHKWADMSKFLSAMGYRLWDKALTEGEAASNCIA